MGGTTATIVLLALFALVGAFIGLFGYRKFSVVLSLLGLCAGVTLGAMVFYLFSMPATAGVPLYVSIGVGVVIGLLTLKIKRLANAACGLLFGAILSFTVVHVLNAMTHYAISQTTISIVTGAILIICTVGFLFSRKLALLLSTSVIGGYLFSFGTMTAFLLFMARDTVETLPVFPNVTAWLVGLKDLFYDFTETTQTLVLIIAVVASVFFLILQLLFSRRRAEEDSFVEEEDRQAIREEHRPQKRPQSAPRERQEEPVQRPANMRPQRPQQADGRPNFQRQQPDAPQDLDDRFSQTRRLEGVPRNRPAGGHAQPTSQVDEWGFPVMQSKYGENLRKLEAETDESFARPTERDRQRPLEGERHPQQQPRPQRPPEDRQRPAQAHPNGSEEQRTQASEPARPVAPRPAEAPRQNTFPATDGFTPPSFDSIRRETEEGGLFTPRRSLRDVAKDTTKK
ncbi:DUF4203 domain-containing protein [Eubacteriales bacterium OttesenSCG-928-M02]|nr:DUF4203 domain-containing protein [Eubacteriales bacterium OttesenSCG-928-M02]